jgi:hypothetical protein
MTLPLPGIPFYLSRGLRAGDAQNRPKGAIDPRPRPDFIPLSHVKFAAESLGIALIWVLARLYGGCEMRLAVTMRPPVQTAVYG